ncbi:hypothetical protein K3G39_12950 [Pontibacter sp. HSC-14F20]|uniref:hypothetical protein n=1 Tax=Pontibacter sp. HSC-14F20 TaxID=2864136 RepID=UPI001C73725D|nr:hypothetical protein [Pontibacter sp. HSC-14F20]MBX0334145.1 hypothetical protein [Pontibacter sp. HSC-14F20]
MLGNIINSVKGQLTGELQDKFKLDPQQANQSVDLAKEHVEEGLKKEATGGDAGGIMNMLKGQQAPQDNPAINNMIQRYLGDLTSKVGIPESMAQQVAPFVVSFLMNKISGNVNSQSDLMGMLGGGLTDKLPKGIGDKLGGLFK